MSLFNNDLQTMSVEEIKHDLFLEEVERNKWHNYWVAIKRNWILYAMIIPVIAYLIIFRYMPIYGILVAFKDPNAAGVNQTDILSLPFTGFESFRIIMFGTQSMDFWRAFRNTFTISMYGLLFGFPIPIILALFFSEIKNELYRSIVQIFSYLPKFISTVVITSIITMMLYQGRNDMAPGVLASLFVNIGVIAPGTAMLRQPQYFRSIYIISDIWEGAGYGSIVYFAAIMAISPTNYEAAKIDGANKLDQIKHITLPGMAPTLTIMLILRIGSILSVGYEKIYLLYDVTTYSTADVISTFVARIGGIIQTSGGPSPNQSLAAAGDLFNSLIAMFLVLGSNFISRRVSDTSLF